MTQLKGGDPIVLTHGIFLRYYYYVCVRFRSSNLMILLADY